MTLKQESFVNRQRFYAALCCGLLLGSTLPAIAGDVDQESGDVYLRAAAVASGDGDDARALQLICTGIAILKRAAPRYIGHLVGAINEARRQAIPVETKLRRFTDRSRTLSRMAESGEDTEDGFQVLRVRFRIPKNPTRDDLREQRLLYLRVSPEIADATFPEHFIVLALESAGRGDFVEARSLLKRARWGYSPSPLDLQQHVHYYSAWIELVAGNRNVAENLFYEVLLRPGPRPNLGLNYEEVESARYLSAWNLRH